MVQLYLPKENNNKKVLRVSITNYNGEAEINLINELLKNDYFFLIKKMAVHSAYESNRKNFKFQYYHYL